VLQVVNISLEFCVGRFLGQAVLLRAHVGGVLTEEILVDAVVQFNVSQPPIV
jgi:hypothetical protein